MAVKYKPNRKNAPVVWPETGRLLARLAADVAAKNNAFYAADDPRRVHAESSAGQSRRVRHRAAVIAASPQARRDQARTNRLLSALAATRV